MLGSGERLFALTARMRSPAGPLNGLLFGVDRKRQAARPNDAFVQILWGERRGHGTMGAVQYLPMELTHVATFSF
jgi:hypothetical protein